MTAKRGILLLFGLVLLLSLVQAQTGTTSADEELTSSLSPSLGYAWLANTSLTRALSTQDQSYAILALLGQGGKEQIIAQLKGKLKDQQDAQNKCWKDQQGCKTRPTALAILALTKAGDKPTLELQKLTSTLLPTLRTNEWRIQIDAPGNGTCTLTWGSGQKKDFTLKDGTILGTSRKYYINIATDLPGGSSLLATPNNKITVDCTQLSGTVTLSLIYAKSTTDLYIVQSYPNTAKADLTIQNGCFPDAFGAGACNYDATLETTWALVEAGTPVETIGTLPYLYSTINNDDTQRAYLARLLTVAEKTPTSLLDQIIQNQKTDGSWKSGDITTTGLTLLALTPSSGNYQDNIANARLFLQRKQSHDGSWKQTVRDTSIALLALQGDITGEAITLSPKPRKPAIKEICDNGIDDDGNEFIDCADADICGKETLCQEEEEPDTSFTDDDIPSLSEDDAPSFDGTIDTDEGGNTGWIIFTILFVLLLGGGTFFYFRYVKTGKINLKDLFTRKKSKQTFEEFKRMAEFKPVQQPKPAQPQRPAARPAPPARPTRPTRSAEDDALDRSLKEAEKLLKKK